MFSFWGLHIYIAGRTYRSPPQVFQRDSKILLLRLQCPYESIVDLAKIQILI